MQHGLLQLPDQQLLELAHWVVAKLLRIDLVGELSAPQTLEAWGVLLIGFAATMMAARGVIADQKRQPIRFHWAATVGFSVLVSMLPFTGFGFPITTLPMFLMS
ncbi:hypothetical protein CA13_61360 [Planctomycetes bacterium CA13]|uniref:Uncharacterized protein n=1 Tax=Novipirellula herctigrandis TaxID=2527986 RepID=A0A5C5ZBZ1_9BACT|nr:hypothetical protein CA13_61360 [Planctomycetes bacterium CA13]